MLEATFTPSLDLSERVFSTLSRPALLEQLGYPREPRYRRLWRHAVRASLGLLTMALVIGALFSGDRVQPWQLAMSLLIAYVSGGIVVLLFDDRRHRRVLAMLFDTTHPLRFVLAAEGIRLEINTTRTFTPWAAVRQVLLTKEFVLMVREDSVLFVPVAAFEDDQALLAFTAYASARVREAAQAVDAAPVAEGGDAKMAR